MATLNGIEIKRIVRKRGYEFPTVASAVVRMDGRKIGDWSQDEYGGPDHFSAGLCGIVRAKAETFREGVSKASRFYNIADSEEVFMDRLATLVEVEEVAKRTMKRGCRTVIILPAREGLVEFSYRSLVSDDLIEKNLGHEEGFRDRIIFRDSVNIDMVVDKDHPAPDWMVRI